MLAPARLAHIHGLWSLWQDDAMRQLLAWLVFGALPAGTYPFNGNVNMGDAGVQKVSGSIVIPADAGVQDAAPSPTPPIPLADAGVRDASTSTPSAGMGRLEPWDPASTSPTGAVLSPGTVTLPAVGGSFIEPAFGTTVTRIASPSSHEYSQLQAFSSDEKFVLLIQDGVGHTVYTWPGMQVVLQEKDVSVGGWSAPRWLPGTHKIVYLTGGPGRVLTVDVDTKAVVEVVRFAEPYLRSAPTFEALSEDGAWTVVWRYGLGSEVVSAVNMNTKAVVPIALSCAASGINWAAASPLGKYAVVQWNADGGGRCQGVELFDIKTGAWVRQISQRHDHGDLGVSAGGAEYYVSVKVAADLNHNYPAIQTLWLEGGAKEVRMLQWGFNHISCQGPHGLCVVDDLVLGSGDVGEVGILRISDGALRRVGFTRSTSGVYWAQPRTTISPSGKTLLLDSDWGTAGGPVSVMAVRLPQSP